MCRNLRPTTQESAVVYKIVAKKPKGTRYYSIAMGFKYPQKGRVPKIRVQHCLAWFSEDILESGSCGYTRDMTGRTAGFLHREDAENQIRRMNKWMNVSFYPFEMLIARVKLTNGLRIGEYGGGTPIIAGKHIEFLETE